MKKNKTVITFIIALMIMVGNISTISADAYEKFSINPIIPNNQINQNVGYYDLKLEPNMKQTLELEVINQGNETMVATVLLADATTNNNASKQFSTIKEPDTSLTTPLTSFTKVREESVEVAPNATEIVHIDIDTDGVDFDGIRLGGITIIADTDANKEQTGSQGVTLNNRVAYTLGVQTRMHDNVENSNLNYIKTEIEVIDLNARFVSVIQNDQPILMNGITLNGTIRDTKTGKVVASVIKQNGSISPNTNFKVVYASEQQTIEPGTYAMDLEINHETSSWRFSDTIEVSEETSTNTNHEVINFNQNSNMFTWMLLSIIGIMLFIIILLVWKRRKDKNNHI